MAKITIRNLNYINSRDTLLHQALSDLVDHISQLKTTNETLQSQIAALQKKVGP